MNNENITQTCPNCDHYVGPSHEDVFGFCSRKKKVVDNNPCEHWKREEFCEMTIGENDYGDWALYYKTGIMGKRNVFKSNVPDFMEGGEYGFPISKGVKKGFETLKKTMVKRIEKEIKQQSKALNSLKKLKFKEMNHI